MKCYGCGHEFTEEDMGIHTIEYRGDEYSFCPDCDNDDNIFTDSEGDQAPRNIAEYVTRYDGESTGELRRPRNFLADNTDYFTCELCNSEFYNSSTYVEDMGDVCSHCADTRCYFSEDDDCFYLSDGPAGSTPREGETDSGFRLFLGEATDRFLANPPIGIEFEHAPVRRGESSAGEHELYSYITRTPEMRYRFVCHYDGSIASLPGYSSKEIVSMPASGKEIDTIIDAFYEPFASGKFSPGPEHPSCGFHIHVGSRFLLKIRQGANTALYPKNVRDTARDMLVAMNSICREYISSSRRDSVYCCDAPSVRDKSFGQPGAHQMAALYGSSAYPSIAVRTIGTIEFRLWPSSNSIKYTKARAELSQKLVDYYDRCLIGGDDEVSLDAEAANNLIALKHLCRGGVRRELTNKLAALIGLSPESIATLTRMSERFNPFTHKKTAFRFTDIQVSTMLEESSLGSTDYVTPTDAHIDTVGDTTLEATRARDGGTDLYISFGTGVRCYPATGAGDQLEAITQLAKGDI